MKKAPLVTITPSVWTDLSTIAGGASRETGGILVGKRMLAGVRFSHHVPVVVVAATDEGLLCDNDEVADAKVAAYRTWAPLEPIGEWHAHVFDVLNADALAPQLSDIDLAQMLLGNYEIIVVVVPKPDRKLKGQGEFLIQRVIGERLCRAEAWFKPNGKRGVPCRIKIRR